MGSANDNYAWINMGPNAMSTTEDSRTTVRRQAMKKAAAARRRRGNWGKLNVRQPLVSQRVGRRGDAASYLDQPREGSAAAHIHDTSIVPPPPCWVASPDLIRRPEELLQITDQFIEGMFDNETWVRGRGSFTTFTSGHASDWGRGIVSANALLRSGKLRDGFKMLNACCEQFRLCLLDSDPALLMYLYFAILALAPDIWSRILAYAAQLSKIALNCRHPLRLILQRLSQTELCQTREVAERVLSHHVDPLRGKAASSELDLCVFKETRRDNTKIVSSLGPAMIEIYKKDVIAVQEQLGHRCNLLFSKLTLSSAYHHMGSPARAKAIWDQVCSEVHMSGLPTTPYNAVDHEEECLTLAQDIYRSARKSRNHPAITLPSEYVAKGGGVNDDRSSEDVQQVGTLQTHLKTLRKVQGFPAEWSVRNAVLMWRLTSAAMRGKTMRLQVRARDWTDRGMFC